MRIELLRPEALAYGNIILPWVPSSGDLIVHYVRVIRDGETIDILQDTQFKTLNAEQGVEASILSGAMLANLQIPGLRVGDQIEYASTTIMREPALPDQRFFSIQAPLQDMPGSFHASEKWVDDDRIRWQSTDDLSDILHQEGNSLDITMDSPAAVNFPERAPARYGYARLVKFSTFGDWSSVSRRLAPLYQQASKLAPGSPLRAKADEIAAKYDNPHDRAMAALALVQDEVRYVYVGMNGQNLRPATAEQTWERRYADCKGKTVMLLGLLAEFGITAEAVLVNSVSDDGLDDRLPSPGSFNHVLVRASIGDERYWLDGTIPGDPRMLTKPLMAYRQVLPLTRAGNDLESLSVDMPTMPTNIEIFEIDASAGYDDPAKIHVRHVKRGVEALAIRTVLQARTAATANTMVERYFRSSGGWIVPDSAAWRWDAESGVLELSLKGTAELD